MARLPQIETLEPCRSAVATVLKSASVSPRRSREERIVSLQLLVHFSPQLWRQIDSWAVLAGFAENYSILVQAIQGSPQCRYLDGREATHDVVFEQVMLSKHLVTVKLVENCSLIPRNGPQTTRNRGGNYEYRLVTYFTQM